MSEMEQRRTSIEEIVRENGAIMLTDIAARLGVTTMTIRRDLETLVKRGKVSLYHGVIIPSKYSNYQLLEAQNVMIEQKMRIAKAAASMITEGDTIILDAGSTVSMLARELPKKISLTIICLSLNSFLNVVDNPNTKVILIGGLYHESSLVFESPENIQLLKRLRANKAFISASGVRHNMGVTCSNQFEIELKKTALDSSVERILLADSSKFGKVNSCFFADLEEFNTIVTDSGLSPENIHLLEGRGIKVITV
jgi:DeoR family deoxyribose operon repressor